MFEQVILEGTSRPNKGWTLLLSSGMQLGLVATLSIVPLLNTDLLPRTTLQMMMVAPVPPPAPPPPAPAAAQLRQAHPVARRAFDGLQLSEPARIPQRVAMLVSDELPPVTGYTGGGVPGGIEGGVPGGLLNMAPRFAQIAPAPPPQAKPVEGAAPIQRVVMGGVVQAARLIHKVIPLYPPLARQARIAGTVRFTAIIARDGTIQNLALVSGHPLLVQAATDAVRQWRYRPTLLNGEPVEVIAPIDVIFILNQ